MLVLKDVKNIFCLYNIIRKDWNFLGLCILLIERLRKNKF